MTRYGHPDMALLRPYRLLPSVAPSPTRSGDKRIASHLPRAARPWDQIGAIDGGQRCRDRGAIATGSFPDCNLWWHC
ncbi:hypothetical protein NDU88_006511, partial [Pleurodeles waltl]